MKDLLLVFLLVFTSDWVLGQIRVETFVGDHEPVFDVFWVKPFEKNSSFQYLNRNKFRLPSYSNQSPQFSTLNVLSYQLGKTGLGLAIAATATNAEFQTRAGIQFQRVRPKEWLIYAIGSTSLGRAGDFRGLLIFQITPKLTKHWRWFNRLEWVSALGYGDYHRFSQGILKEGVQIQRWQFGFGTELLWLGRSFASVKQNWGLFVAREF